VPSPFSLSQEKFLILIESICLKTEIKPDVCSGASGKT